MARRQASLDPEVFTRTASLFAAKRGAFAPDAVGALATDIVRRLADFRSEDPLFDAPVIAEDSIAAFCDALVKPGSDASLRFIQDRRDEGVTRQAVYLGYITGAARHLGQGWEEDRFSFLQVTIGTGHLYALMRALRAEGSAQRVRFDIRRSALFATVPGEDHGIGITVAADIFRDAGWEIDLQTATNHDALMAHVERTHPLIIGLSLSTEQRLDALVRLVVAMRLVVPEAIIGVAPAATVDAKRLRTLADIDLIFTDAPSAYRELDRLIRLRD
ncbi:MAG: cobalamin-dependent protein [Rhodobacteraceae bacterium]|nr:cobalamin-dependent protein [Paracoccaceae bacterium]MCZ8083825.1 cobalamin-dependent protein [Paracoccaceae bacterium]